MHIYISTYLHQEFFDDFIAQWLEMAGVQKMSIGIGMGDCKRQSRPSARKSVQPDFFGRIKSAITKSHNQSSSSTRISISKRYNNMNKIITNRLDEMSRAADSSKLQFDQLAALVNSLSSELASSRSTVKELQQQLHDIVIHNYPPHLSPTFCKLVSKVDSLDASVVTLQQHNSSLLLENQSFSSRLTTNKLDNQKDIHRLELVCSESNTLLESKVLELGTFARKAVLDSIRSTQELLTSHIPRTEQPHVQFHEQVHSQVVPPVDLSPRVLALEEKLTGVTTTLLSQTLCADELLLLSDQVAQVHKHIYQSDTQHPSLLHQVPLSENKNMTSGLVKVLPLPPPPVLNTTTLDLSSNPSVIQIHSKLELLKERNDNLEALFRPHKIVEHHQQMLENFTGHQEHHLRDLQVFSEHACQVAEIQTHVASLTEYLSFDHYYPYGKPPPKLEEELLRLELTLDRMRRFHYFKLTDSKVALVPG
jgi:hypothetical protein